MTTDWRGIFLDIALYGGSATLTVLVFGSLYYVITDPMGYQNALVDILNSAIDMQHWILAI